MTGNNATYILGAGPAGMAAAYTLAKSKCPVTIIERDDQVGGLSKSIHYKGFILDYGPHFFLTDIEEVMQFWDDVMKEEQTSYTRKTQMYWRDRFYKYPPDPIEVLRGVGREHSYSYLLRLGEGTPQNATSKLC